MGYVGGGHGVVVGFVVFEMHSAGCCYGWWDGEGICAKWVKRGVDGWWGN